MPHTRDDHIQFAKNPLRLVVCQARFPVLPRYSEGGFVSPFIEALRAQYPGAVREQQVGVQISPAGISTSAPDFLWRLTSRDNQWAVVLGESSVALEARSYSTIDKFASRLEEVLAATCHHLGVSERTRIGLRYINEIRYPQADDLDDWRKLLRPEFLGFAASNVITGRVEHVLQEVQFQRDDGTLMVRHGLLPGAVVAPVPPEPLATGRFYLIDLDYFDANQRPLDIPETMALIHDYNEVMSTFFRSTLTEKLYQYLEPIYGSDR